MRGYALRNRQEQSFRDLKSGGWNWQQSHIWQPDHAQVPLSVLALAYAEPAIQAQIGRGTKRLYSIFREGLGYWLDLIGSRKPFYLGLFFAPDKPFTWKLSSPQQRAGEGNER